MYCKTCQYPLNDLKTRECPECERTFDPADATTFAAMLIRVPWYQAFIGAGIVLLVLFWCIASVGDPMPFGIFIDEPSFIAFGLFFIGGMWLSFGPVNVIRAIKLALFPRKDVRASQCELALVIYMRAYQLAWAAGLIVVVMGLVGMLQNMDDPSMIGPGIAVAILPVLYSALLAELIIAPLQSLMIVRHGLADLHIKRDLRAAASIIGIVFTVVLAVALIFFTLIVARIGI